MKKLINTYNHTESLFLISLYPNKGEVYSAGVTGVAAYAKNTIANMQRKVIVLAQQNEGFAAYEEDNTFVLRCFKPKTYTLWAHLLRNIIRFPAVKKVLVQFDFGMYGSITSTALILPFLAILKLFGYKTYVVNHHVISDVKKLSGHVGLGTSVKDLIKGHIYNIIFHLFYRLLGYCSHKIVVLEEPLKQRLGHYTKAENIITIPHAVDTSLSQIDKNEARAQLGIQENEYLVMFFGFVNWFKGADFFVHAFQNTERIVDKKTHFVVAGGISPTLKDKEYYQKYFNKVQGSISASKNVSITGYIPQEDISAYFSAADLVVFPYREFMCASGVLSLVFSYQKPFIVSDRLSPMFDTKEFKKALKLADLRKSDLTFNLNRASCINTTQKVLENGLKSKMVTLTEILRDQRSFTNNSPLYEELIFQNAIAPAFLSLDTNKA